MNRSEMAENAADKLEIGNTSVDNTESCVLEAMKQVSDAFREIGQIIARLADELSPKEKPEQPIEKTVGLGEVRNALRDLSLSRGNAQMRALLSKFGANRLSNVKPERYEELLTAARETMIPNKLPQNKTGNSAV